MSNHLASFSSQQRLTFVLPDRHEEEWSVAQHRRTLSLSPVVPQVAVVTIEHKGHHEHIKYRPRRFCTMWPHLSSHRCALQHSECSHTRQNSSFTTRYSGEMATNSTNKQHTARLGQNSGAMYKHPHKLPQADSTQESSNTVAPRDCTPLVSL